MSPLLFAPFAKFDAIYLRGIIFDIFVRRKYDFYLNCQSHAGRKTPLHNLTNYIPNFFPLPPKILPNLLVRSANFQECFCVHLNSNNPRL